MRLLRGGTAAAARCILTSRAGVGGLRGVVGFTHGYNITLKGAFVKGECGTKNRLPFFLTTAKEFGNTPPLPCAI